MESELKELKSKLSEIKKQQDKIDKMISKNEEDDYYDGSLYEELEKLEDERNDLMMQIEAIEYNNTKNNVEE